MESTRYSCQILIKIGFFRQIFEKSRTSNSIKIRPVEADLFHAYRQTDGQAGMTKKIVDFRNFSKALKMFRYFRNAVSNSR